MSVAEEMLLDEVTEFDKRRFDQDEWQIDEWRDQKTRHIALHIAKLPLKLLSGDRGVIIDEAMPDMALYRTQLINTHLLVNNPSLPHLLLSRIDGRRFPILKQRIETLGVHEFALHRAAAANGYLAGYLEPGEHGTVSDDVRIEKVLSAVHDLQLGALSLAERYDRDLEQSLRQRIQQHLNG